MLFCGLASQARGVTVWIDSDPSIGLPFREVDDAFALILAFHSPEIRIAGISTTYGNASLKDTTRIARDLVTRFDRKKCGVYAGARSPRDFARTDASEAFATALRKERLTYIALGPLTNLATFFRLHPNLATQIDQIILVGGQTSGERLRAGWLTIHDANVYKDPIAVAAVLKSKCPIDLAPIETSMQLQVTAADLQAMRHRAAGDFLYRHTRLWSWFWRRVVGLDGGPVFDVLPILAIARPDCVASDERYVTLDHNGRLIVAEARSAHGRQVHVLRAFTSGTKQWICDHS